MYVMHPHAESLSQPCLLVFLCTAGWAGLCTHSHVTGMTRSTGRIVADAHRAHTATIWKRADFARRQGATGCVVRVRRGPPAGGKVRNSARWSSFVTFVCVVCAWFASCVCEGLHRGAGFEWRHSPHVFFTETGGSGAYAQEQTPTPTGGWVRASPSYALCSQNGVCTVTSQIVLKF
jgi:hypothetical protein